MSRVIQPDRQPITVQTRKGNNIRCKPPRPAITPQELAKCRQEFDCYLRPKLQYPNEVIERRIPTLAYNCHGLTFLARRAWLDEEDEQTLGTVLADDGYVEIPANQVRPGDIVVYRYSNGQIEHTGVVIWVDGQSPPVPWVLSKWGNHGEYIHRSNNRPYEGMAVYMREGANDI